MSRLRRRVRILGVGGCLLILTIWTNAAFAAEASHEAQTDWSKLGAATGTTAGAFIMAFLTYVLPRFRKLKREYAETRNKLSSAEARLAEVTDALFKPPKIGANDKRTSALVLGLGGVGKTTLINAFGGKELADSKRATAYFTIYRAGFTAASVLRDPTKKQTAPDNSMSWIFISDYKGQDLGTLIRSYIKEQKTPHSPLAYDYIDALILVVDIASPEPNTQPGHIASIDMARVALHIDQWNDTALDAVFGLLTARLSYVCLFINKIDLVVNQSQESQAEILKIFSALKARLEKRCRNTAHFESLLGSAAKGTEIVALKDALVERGSPPDNETTT